MILSVSRRTDIPNYFPEWFYNRIREGAAYVRNPMNPHQVSRIGLSPEVVDCIVFWTKNPEPMLERLEYHLRAFEQIAGALKGCTEKCVVSFVDTYAKTKKNMASVGAYEPEEAMLLEFAGSLSKIAGDNGITVASCAEGIDLRQCGIEHNCCIDKGLIEAILGCKIKAEKDKNQRPECGCIESVDIGAYNTCKNGCRYCYANYSGDSVAGKLAEYDPLSPLLCGKITKEDKISERKMRSLKDEQISLFDSSLSNPLLM